MSTVILKKFFPKICIFCEFLNKFMILITVYIFSVHQNSVTKLRPSISVSANPLRKYSRECKHAAKKAKATNKDYVLVRTTSKKKKNKIDRDTHYPTSTDENSDCSCCSTDEMMKRARANKKSVPTRY